MKTRITIPLTVVAMAMAVPAIGTAQYDQSRDMSSYRALDSAYTLRASDLIGMEVTGARDEDIGEIDDLVMNRSDNTIQAIVSVGGFLGIGDKLVAVPYDQLRFSQDGDDIYMDATEESLEALPEFSYYEGELWGREIYDARTVSQNISDDMGIGENTGEQLAANTHTQNVMHDDDQMIDWQKLDDNWDEFSASVAAKWDELTEEDLRELRNKGETMAETIADRTGEAVEEVKRSLHEMTAEL